MSAHNPPSNYKATIQTQSVQHTEAPPETESRIDKGYLISVRAILKYACLLFCFTAFVCVASTPQCSGNHVFLSVVTVLVTIMQISIIVVYVFRLRTKFSGIDFELLDFFATSYQALNLLIASIAIINYCRIPGQMAGGAMGIVASLFLIGDAIIIFLAQRKDTDTNTQHSGTR
ncbi:unnamed protein product [Rotaria magnacalcarata]|uniref:MARVEL domain-containing protein n=2 Tax=Rotaria magnacalcarata TaxID=392030 RepID=A0A819MXN8_9BILA|nr:unnamed protein product [Rotaria magnacalcarata]CAF3985324.1 unnamed protein product [Rotaria magnacalcarata]